MSVHQVDAKTGKGMKMEKVGIRCDVGRDGVVVGVGFGCNGQGIRGNNYIIV